MSPNSFYITIKKYAAAIPFDPLYVFILPPLNIEIIPPTMVFILLSSYGFVDRRIFCPIWLFSLIGNNSKKEI